MCSVKRYTPVHAENNVAIKPALQPPSQAANVTGMMNSMTGPWKLNSRTKIH